MRFFYRILRLCLLACVLIASFAGAKAQGIGAGERYIYDTAFCISEAFPINLNTISEKQLPPRAGMWVDAGTGNEVTNIFDPDGKSAGRYEYYFFPSKTVCGLYPGDTVSVIIDLFPSEALRDFVFSICEPTVKNLWSTITSVPIDSSYIVWYDKDNNKLSASEVLAAIVGHEDVTSYYYKVDHSNICIQDSGFVYFNLDSIPYDLGNTKTNVITYCTDNLPDLVNLNNVIGGVAEKWELKDYALQTPALQDLVDSLLHNDDGTFHLKGVLSTLFREFEFVATSTTSTCDAGAHNKVKLVINDAATSFDVQGGDTLVICNTDINKVYDLNRYITINLPVYDVRWTSDDVAAQSFLDTLGVIDARNLSAGFYKFTATYTKDTSACGIDSGAQADIYLLIEDKLEFGTTDLQASVCYGSSISLNALMPTQLNVFDIEYSLVNPVDSTLTLLSRSEVLDFSPSNYPSVISDTADANYKILYTISNNTCVDTVYHDTIFLHVVTGSEPDSLTDKAIYACYTSADQLRLQNVLGFHGKGTWASTGQVAYFDDSTGIFYAKTQYLADYTNGGEGVYEFTFTPDASNSCLASTNSAKVTVTLTDDLGTSVPAENYSVIDTIWNEDRHPVDLIDYLELSSLEGYWTLDSLNLSGSTVIDLEDTQRYPVGKYTYTYVVPANGEHCVQDTTYFNVTLVVYGLPLNVVDSLLPITCHTEDNGGISIAVIEGSKPYKMWLTQNGTDSLNNTVIDTIFYGEYAAEFDTTFVSLEGVYDVLITDFANDSFAQRYEIIRPDLITVNEIALHNVTSNRRNNGVLELRISGGIDPYYAIVVGNCDPILDTCYNFVTDSVIWSSVDSTQRYFLSYDSLPAGDYHIYVMDSSRYYYYANDDSVTINLANLDAGVCAIDTFFTLDNDPLILDCPDTLRVYGNKDCQFTVPNVKALVEMSGGSEDYDITVLVQDPETGEYIRDILPSDIDKYYIVKVFAVAPDASGATDTSGVAILDTLDDCQVVLEVTCREDLKVGQLVTPNNDGNNDTWLIQGLENYPNHSVRVYGRWGDMVFEATHYANDWAADCRTSNCMGNGTLPAGTYFWVIDLGPEGNGEIINGFLEVVY